MLGSPVIKSILHTVFDGTILLPFHFVSATTEKELRYGFRRRRGLEALCYDRAVILPVQHRYDVQWSKIVGLRRTSDANHPM